MPWHANHLVPGRQRASQGLDAHRNEQAPVPPGSLAESNAPRNEPVPPVAAGEAQGPGVTQPAVVWYDLRRGDEPAAEVALRDGAASARP